MLTTPRMYYAMARDGVFFQRLAEVHPRFGTPAFAIVALAAGAAVLAASGTFEQLLTYVVFTGVDLLRRSARWRDRLRRRSLTRRGRSGCRAIR